MSVNEIQVGGAHYRTSYQHWDWMVDCDLPYLIGCATKYLVRWRQKNGVEDLKKSQHYISKIHEVFIQGRQNNFMTEDFYRKREGLTKLFVEKNSDTISKVEGNLIIGLALWQNGPDLEILMSSLQKVIDFEEDALLHLGAVNYKATHQERRIALARDL